MFLADIFRIVSFQTTAKQTLATTDPHVFALKLLKISDSKDKEKYEQASILFSFEFRCDLSSLLSLHDTSARTEMKSGIGVHSSYAGDLVVG